MCLQPPMSKETEVEIVTSTKGRDKIAFHGYMYWLDHRLQSRVTWSCEVSSCKGQLATPLDYSTNNTFLKEHGEHRHPPNVTSVEVARARRNMHQDGLTWLHKNCHWHCDGTFKVRRC